MTRSERAKKNTTDKQKKNKALIINMVTGLYQDEYRKPSGSWNINKIAEHAGVTRQTASKHLRLWEANVGGLFEEELATIEGLTD